MVNLISIYNGRIYIHLVIQIAILIILLGSVLSAIFYHLGGMGGAWWKNSKMRDWICPLVFLAVMQHTNIWHWSLYPSALLMWLALSTYHKWLNPIFNKTKEDCHWHNWLVHGFVIGLALLPYGYYTHTMELVLFRAYILGTLMMIWSELEDRVAWEEGGRGFLIIATLLIFKGGNTWM